MQLAFFPSRTLTLYLARTFVARILAVLVMLVLVLQVLDLLGESGDIMSYPGNGQGELWTYVTLRVPQLIARFLPYSVLLATIITLATLNQNSEVIAMKASGLSAHQILAPLILTAIAIAAISFVFNERVVTRATATLKAWSAADYGPLPRDSGARSNVYLRDGDNILLATTLTGQGKAMVMHGVTWYRRDSRGLITEHVRSPRAVFADPGWRLEQPVRFYVTKAQTTSPAPFVVAPQLGITEVVTHGVDADAQNIFALGASINALSDAGRPTAELKGKWWHKISGPLSAVLMPLLGAIAGFGLARSGKLLVRAVLGMALGFAFFVFDNAALALGNFGAYPPMVAAWGPFLLFMLVGEVVLLRTEE